MSTHIVLQCLHISALIFQHFVPLLTRRALREQRCLRTGLLSQLEQFSKTIYQSHPVSRNDTKLKITIWEIVRKFQVQLEQGKPGGHGWVTGMLPVGCGSRVGRFLWDRLRATVAATAVPALAWGPDFKVCLSTKPRNTSFLRLWKQGAVFGRSSKTCEACLSSSSLGWKKGTHNKHRASSACYSVPTPQ